jgi:hypothetical protein
MVRGDVDGLVGMRFDEMRLTAAELAIRMQLAEEELSAGAQHARRLAEYGREVLHVLEHEVAHDDVHRRRLHRPRARDVVLDEACRRRAHATSRDVEHAG